MRALLIDTFFGNKNDRNFILFKIMFIFVIERVMVEHFVCYVIHKQEKKCIWYVFWRRGGHVCCVYNFQFNISESVITRPSFFIFLCCFLASVSYKRGRWGEACLLWFRSISNKNAVTTGFTSLPVRAFRKHVTCIQFRTLPFWTFFFLERLW